MDGQDPRRRRQAELDIIRLQTRYSNPDIHDGGAGAVLTRLQAQGLITGLTLDKKDWI